MEKYVGIGLLP